MKYSPYSRIANEAMTWHCENGSVIAVAVVEVISKNYYPAIHLQEYNLKSFQYIIFLNTSYGDNMC